MAFVRPRRAAALLALLCLAALLCGDAVRGFHLLTAHHVVCAAHGELVEADPGIPPAGIDDGGFAGVLPAADADHHDHCSVAATPTRPLAAQITRAALARAVNPDASIVSLPAQASVHVRIVLAYAPKQGPPGNDGSRRS